MIMVVLMMTTTWTMDKLLMTDDFENGKEDDFFSATASAVFW